MSELKVGNPVTCGVCGGTRLYGYPCLACQRDENPTPAIERQARESFEDAMRAFLALPAGAYGRIVLNVGTDGRVKPSLELFLATQNAARLLSQS